MNRSTQASEASLAASSNMLDLRLACIETRFTLDVAKSKFTPELKGENKQITGK